MNTSRHYLLVFVAPAVFCLSYAAFECRCIEIQLIVAFKIEGDAYSLSVHILLSRFAALMYPAGEMLGVFNITIVLSEQQQGFSLILRLSK
jgi:NADH:ubiquinone oxidoreductase subunit K